MNATLHKTAAYVALVAGLAACYWVNSAWALLIGIVIGLAQLNPVPQLTKPLSTKLLQASVIGLGAGMNLAVLIRVGASGVLYTIVGIALAFALGIFLGRRAKVPRDITLLITGGTAICGGSAIAAIAGVIRPKSEDATVALATVFLLNAAALFIFPALGHFFKLDPQAFGLWSALAIHDTSSVVGAAGNYDPESLPVATTVKLTRALWIAPLSLVIGWAVSRNRNKDAAATRRRPPIPWFIFGFIAAAAVVTWIPPLADAGREVAAFARRLLVLTLFLIGANLTPAALRAVGVRPLVLGVTLWFAVSALTLLAINFGWIR
ncbi:putative integral membrane protein (TIGR00698 family) [Ereboglobus sp. PH5-10]|uniref:YeiH family protein n=1 Tax=Ereboglobus sp. PH5-10 TaxID=2940629 RepID=UPI002405B8F4|nr:putative sulfate exporter family transporter [Ereboglobus sp. PH5-10]MDF9826890.1 putative integral membrane protein (TIGR00698 family) [Ereboglobus sp. PH5-10]